MNRHFKLIVAGYNCSRFAQRCIDSIAEQTYDNYEVCLVDDASTDGTGFIVSNAATRHGWKHLIRYENAGAMLSQYEGILKLDPKGTDVIVWVDLDDALAHKYVLAHLNQYYSDGEVLMTYGNYQSVPFSDTCPIPQPYPEECIRTRDFRNAHRWGLQFNHLRTVSWELFKHLDPQVDFKMNGEWFKLGADAAVMIPCLEMAGHRVKVISEIMYHYTSDNPISEWRKAPAGTNEMHDYVFHRIPKKDMI